MARILTINGVQCKLVEQVNNTINVCFRNTPQEKVNSMTLDEFTEFDRVMYRTFNFIWTVEELDIEEVNNLQANQKEDTLSMTSKELFDFFKKNLSMNIE